MYRPLSIPLRLTITSILIVAAGAPQLEPASAQRKCQSAVSKVANGTVVTKLTTRTRKGRCLVGAAAALTGPAGASEATGPTGANGAYGQLRVYGDDSSRELIISGSATLLDVSSMFTDEVINNGATLTVPSGTVIRRTGTFTNNGMINVNEGASGGQNVGIDNGISPINEGACRRLRIEFTRAPESWGRDL